MTLPAPTARRSSWSSDVAILGYLAAATLVVHLLTGGRYGYHRDELATLDDARHLAWGYVAYPPVTPFFGRISLLLFGTSLTGFRFFAALADAIAVWLTGLIAREMGARRTAQLVAAAAAIPFALAAGVLMQYVSFDYLWWVLLSYLVTRLCKADDPRWWLPIGIVIGLGMLTKYTALFCVAGIGAGVLLTPLRRHLKTKWLWIGAGCSVLMFSPNFTWQLRHGFPSLEFLRAIHARDVRIGRTKDFLPDQLLLNLFSVPLVIAGLFFFLLSPAGRRFRALGWMYVTPLILFIIAKGRGYYLAPAYPALYAGGAFWLERRLETIGRAWRRGINGVVWAMLAANIVLTSAFMLPLAPVNSERWRSTAKIRDDFVEEIGWPELVETVARIRDSLPREDLARLGILAGNYGEAGAINLYGPAYGLPQAISGVNSFWERGYGDPPPETLIVVGMSREFVEQYFEQFEVVAHSSNRYGVANEETMRHPDIFVCRRFRESWPEFWKHFRRYG